MSSVGILNHEESRFVLYSHLLETQQNTNVSIITKQIINATIQLLINK